MKTKTKELIFNLKEITKAISFLEDSARNNGFEVEVTLTPILKKSLPKEKDDPHGLSKKEKEVMTHLSSGDSTAKIARKMGVSLNTIKTHLNHIYAKLAVNNRTQAVIAYKQ